jgi:ring-1,2-phenylacetyl-CoA epoxidase subunit PaaC
MNNPIIDYLLHLADTTLILSQRNAEWCGHGPVLEQDIAITNISLDLLGQARNFYQYAAQIMNGVQSQAGEVPGGEVTEDSLAYLRKERAFKNPLLVEQPNGHWGQTILRQYLFSQFQYLLFEKLQHSSDAQIAAITTKALKEITYHVRWSGEWVVRLGDGTDESNARMQEAIDNLWPYTAELFIPAAYETEASAASIGADITLLKPDWEAKVKDIFAEAALPMPAPAVFGGPWMKSGKEGTHSEHLGFILTELQYMQRAWPGCEW